jgi:hypothetical protein
VVHDTAADPSVLIAARGPYVAVASPD